MTLPVVAVLAVRRVEHELLGEERLRLHLVADEPGADRSARSFSGPRPSPCSTARRRRRRQRFVNRDSRLAAQVARGSAATSR